VAAAIQLSHFRGENENKTRGCVEVRQTDRQTDSSVSAVGRPAGRPAAAGICTTGSGYRRMVLQANGSTANFKINK
jgi:hypothetical protein